MTTNAPTNAYREAGVDIDAGNRAVELMRGAVRSTFTPNVLADVGSFGGLFALTGLPAQPVLVGSIDGVGTKVKLAAELGRWQGVGQDLVNHCVNDILVQNARPLFFLDYIASSKLDPQAVAEVVTGMAEACRAARCALIGGETAEMPGVYAEGAFDVAGAVVGLVDRASLLPRQDEMAAGDMLVGIPSSGPHTNGYSLIRRAVAGQDMHQVLADGQPLADALLAPHRLYLAEVEAIQAAGCTIKGMAHITGGGFVENVPRMLPPNLAARIVAKSWAIPPLFQQLIRWSGISREESYRVFNLGIGMVLVLDASCAEPVLDLLPEATVIGRLIARTADEPPIQIVFPEKP